MKVRGLFVVFFSTSKKLLRNFWIQKWSNTTCPHIQWTCEHVVPKSLIPEHDDLSNLILLPGRLNNIRSNYPYIHNNTMNGTIKTIYPCFHEKCACNMTGQLVAKKFFIPPDFWKGIISRSVLSMKDKYPHHEQLIHKKVLDLDIASLWNQTFPMTSDEQEWNSIINGKSHKLGNPP